MSENIIVWRLRRLRLKLEQQIAQLDEQAAELGCDADDLRDANGGMPYLGALVSLSAVELALLQWEERGEPELCGQAASGAEDWPCVLPAGHVEWHRDRDGDTWAT